MVLRFMPGGTGEAPSLAALMRRAFDPAYGEAWTEGQLVGALALPGGWLELAEIDGDLAGFTLTRRTLDEAELLLCAVEPVHRGHGLGRELLRRAMRGAASRRATSMFLEVRENNATARTLYEREGFVAVGRRRGYYLGSDGRRYDAITMRRALEPPARG